MSEDHLAEDQGAEEQTEALGQDQQGDEDYEEITSEEVDRVMTALDVLLATVESENIQAILEDAIDSIYYLVYEDEGEDDESLSEAA